MTQEQNPKTVLYFAENAISTIQGGGIVVYSVLKGLPAENILGFYDYPNITPVPEYKDRMIRLRRWKAFRILLYREYKLYEALSELGRVFRLPLDILLALNGLYLYLMGNAIAKKDLLKVLAHVKEDRFKPDIVYFSGLSLRYLQLAVTVALHFDVPMVLLHMDNWMAREKYLLGPMGNLWYRRIVKYMKMAAERSLSSTTNSPALAEVVTRITGHKHEAVNNCCPDMSKGRHFPLTENDIPVITYAGAMNIHLQGKALTIISHAITELNAEGCRVHLHIYTPWEFAPIANAIQIPDAVFYKGQVSKERLAQVYAESDFLLNTTTFDDNKLILFRHSLATKLSEHLCIGKPVISAGSPSWHLHEYVRDNGCGFNICDKDLNAIKNQLRSILSTPREELLQIGKNNRRLWQKAHDVNIQSQKTRESLGLGPYPE